jgi:hypothetical protein
LDDVRDQSLELVNLLPQCFLGPESFIPRAMTTASFPYKAKHDSD